MGKMKLVGFVALVAVPALGWADLPTLPFRPLPEPESLALVGIGAVALIIARWAKRR